jgi:hypothetical protein
MRWKRKHSKKSLEPQMSVSAIERGVVAGFFDGDGWLEIPRSRERDWHPAPAICFSQSCDSGIPPELLYVQRLYGGNMSQRGKPAVSNPLATRNCWVLKIRSKSESEAILIALLETCVLKQPQVRLALEYIRGIRPNAEASGLIGEAKRNYQTVDIDAARITKPYVAGLFAADGSVGIYKVGQRNIGYYLRGSITKKSCIRLLEVMQLVFGVGTVQQGNWWFRGKEAMIVLQGITPMLVGQKKHQVELAIRYQEISTNRNGKRRTASEIEEEAEAARQIKLAKKT